VPFCVRAIAVFAFVAFLSLGHSVCAQVTPPLQDTETTPPEPPSAGTPQVLEVGPDIYYVKDENGDLIKVLNLTMPELHRMMQRDPKQTDANPQLPSFTVQSLQVRGKHVETRVQLTVEVTIRLLTEDWVRVPLRLGNAVWREPPRHEGDTEAVVLSEGPNEGYACWLRGSEGQFCTVTLELMAAVEQVGNEFRLDLQLPRATSSTFDLEVPIRGATAMVSNGLLEVVEAGAGSRLVVSGVGGDFRLVWRKGEPGQANPRPLLEASIEQVVKVDGVRQVTADLRLRVSSLRGEFDAFTVRLPVGARLFPRQFNQSGLRLTELPDADTGAKLVQVKLDRAATAAVDVQLLIEYVAAANGKTSDYDLGGFEVEDAFRQSGTIDFVVKSDIKLTWKPVAGVQRTFVPESLRQKLLARFEMTRRSYSLLMQVSSKDTQVSVEPVYQLYVDRHHVRLDATFKYRIRGASLYGLNVQLPGWQVTRIAPETAIDTESLELGKTDPLFIPLTSAAMTESGELILQLTAQQPIPAGAEQISLTLPRPEAKSLTPASVVVVSADNLELTVSDEDSKGLERDPFPPVLDLPQEQRRPLFYRERSEAAASMLVAQLEVRPRSVSVSAEADVKLDARTIRVQQRFQYRVAYEALRRLHFVMPRELFEAGDVQFVYRQQALPLVEWHAAESDNSASPPQNEPWIRVEVDPLGELLGAHEIVVHHDRSLSEVASEQESPLAVSLVQPWLGDGTVVTGNAVRVQGGPDISFRLSDERWEPSEGGAGVPTGELSLTADGMPLDVALQVSRRDVRRQTSTVVSRAWIETRLDATARRDRAVFRIVTNLDRVAFQLPADADLLRVGLDGRDVTDLVLRDQQQTRSIEVPPGQEHVLEIWYTTPVTAHWPAVFNLDVPRVAEAKSNQRVYWTLMMPPQIHLLLPPGGMTPELTWTWRGLFWGRASRLQSADLERWVGATQQSGELPQTVNHYLFSSFGTLDRMQFSVATRGTALILMSGAALLTGLALIYFRRLRHPAVLFVGGLAVFTLILWMPDLAAALAQAAALGLLLGLTACVLKWTVDRRLASGSVIQGVAYASPDSQTVRAPVVQSESKAAPQTTTLPGSILVAESKA
jgi:hypothetical protein